MVNNENESSKNKHNNQDPSSIDNANRKPMDRKHYNKLKLSYEEFLKSKYQ